MRKDLIAYKDLYISETEDHLQKLNEKLLLLEKNLRDKELLNQLMMSAHTIKGASSTMGFEKIANLSHVMENVFDFARHDKLSLDRDMLDIVFRAVDRITASIESIKTNEQEISSKEITDQLRKITGVKTVGTEDSVLAEVSESFPLQKEKKILEQFIDSAEESPKETIQKEIDFIKVPTERLDNLVELMEQLLINKMKLENLVDPKVIKSDKQSITIDELRPIVNHLTRLVSDIQYSVIQSRLVPVGQIFTRFPRMMRDLSRKKEKEIELEIIGEEIELDRTIIDKLADPLVHLLRNAVDHGIEQEGKIRLIARRKKKIVQIIVEDSGKGIDLEKVKKSAIESKILQGQAVSELSKTEILNLIFDPNLSTKTEVTQTSGRGVGLSVVKKFVNQVRGRILVDTPINEVGGTRFTLELPLTIAIIKGLLIKIGGHIFAVPFASIERSVNVNSFDIKSTADQEVALIGDQEIPLVRLKKIFHLESSTDSSDEFETIVLVEYGQSTAGLVVDELLSEQEIMVKPFSSILESAKGFSGSTILGNGQTVLILDINELLENRFRLER